MRWFEERPSMVLIECLNGTFVRNISRFESLHFGCLYEKVGEWSIRYVSVSAWLFRVTPFVFLFGLFHN